MFNGLQVVFVLGSYRIICPEHREAFVVHPPVAVNGRIFCKCVICPNSATWASAAERDDEIRNFWRSFKQPN